MKKFKLKGGALIKRHKIAVLMQAINSELPGRFVGEALNLRWVVCNEK